MVTNDSAPDVIELVHLLQSAAASSVELDARIDCFLTGRLFAGMEVRRRYRWCAPDDGSGMPMGPRIQTTEARAHWSDDIMALLGLVPDNHDFSLGMRDGVVWAWIQPHDDWQPAAHEMRHDHPGGSGLVVAQTLPLAMTAAIVILRTWPGGMR